MKRQATKFTVFLLLLVTMHNTQVSAQCPAGTATATTNWDNLDYLVTSGFYSGFVTPAMAATQAFTIGRTGFTIAFPGTITNTGENILNTAEAGSFGAGSDISYSGNGTVTITFDTVVRNLQFSLYDIDALQTAQVRAWDASGTPLNIVMNVVTVGITAVVGSGGTAPIGTALNIAAANNDTRGTLNISIAGNAPAGTNGVKRVDIVLGGTAGNWWLSDITACVFGSFPINYFAALQTFTGTPTYVIATSDTNTVSLINISTGQAKMIFQDNTSPKYINALGYDHITHNLYYVWDFTATPSTNKTLRKYNFATQALSTVIADVNTLGIPVFTRGVESAGCAFYDGNLYFGIEGNRSGNGGNRESIIWRISFDASSNPIYARQVYATPSDDGAGNLMHDWGDFAIADGILYDFNSSTAGTAQPKYTHISMQTGATLNTYIASNLEIPRQTGQIWNNTMYNVFDSISVYNGNGTLGPRTRVVGLTGNDWTGTCGDATAFRPKYDMGDAPASYDPVLPSTAIHIRDTMIYIGGTPDEEYAKISSSLADADGADEDGLATVPIFSPGAGNYLAEVNVYNHTGGDATLCAWLDFDGNGLFDAAEGITQVVASSTSIQSKFLYWPSAPTALPNGSFTYLRIRLTTAANGMTVANANGYYSNGEIEDYRIIVDNFPLGINLITFDAKAVNNKIAKLTWTADEQPGFAGYEIQRSTDSRTWQKIAEISGKTFSGSFNYQYNDEYAVKGMSYYRLKLKENNGSYRYSEVKTVSISDLNSSVNIVPNPAKYFTTININAGGNSDATIRIMNSIGGLIHSKTLKLISGSNAYELPIRKDWPVGTYIVQVIVDDQVTNKKLVISK